MNCVHAASSGGSSVATGESGERFDRSAERLGTGGRCQRGESRGPQLGVELSGRGAADCRMTAGGRRGRPGRDHHADDRAAVARGSARATRSRNVAMDGSISSRTLSDKRSGHRRQRRVAIGGHRRQQLAAGGRQHTIALEIGHEAAERVARSRARQRTRSARSSARSGCARSPPTPPGRSTGPWCRDACPTTPRACRARCLRDCAGARATAGSRCAAPAAWSSGQRRDQTADHRRADESAAARAARRPRSRPTSPSRAASGASTAPSAHERIDRDVCDHRILARRERQHAPPAASVAPMRLRPVIASSVHARIRVGERPARRAASPRRRARRADRPARGARTRARPDRRPASRAPASRPRRPAASA